MEWTIFGIIIFILIMAILEIINEPKDKKIERIKIQKQTIKPISLIHISGIPNYESGVKVKFYKNLNEINIDKTYSIPIKNIESTSLNSSKQLTEQQKSVISRALVGGLLLGGVGAIIGGISGVGTQQETTMMWMITINYKNYGENKTTILATNDESLIPHLRIALNAY